MKNFKHVSLYIPMISQILDISKLLISRYQTAAPYSLSIVFLPSIPRCVSASVTLLTPLPGHLNGPRRQKRDACDRMLIQAILASPA